MRIHYFIVMASFLVFAKAGHAERGPCSINHIPVSSALMFSLGGGEMNPLATVVRYEFKGSARLTNTETYEVSKTALAFTRVERHPTGQEISRTQEYYSLEWNGPGFSGLRFVKM